jgi:hypothetical protein
VACIIVISDSPPELARHSYLFADGAAGTVGSRYIGLQQLRSLFHPALGFGSASCVLQLAAQAQFTAHLLNIVAE